MKTFFLTFLIVVVLKFIDKGLNWLIKKAANTPKKWDDIVLEVIQNIIQFLIGLISIKRK